MKRQPNIVVIVADDMGYGDCGCYGSPTLATPHIDGLAAAGVRFTDFHANGAVCSPTRAALLTGRYQQRAGIEGVITAVSHRQVGLAASETTFAELLQAGGYRTAIFGKWHLGYQPEFNPVSRGFDEYRGFVSGNIDYFSHIDQAGYEDWWQADALAPEDGYTTDLVTRHGVRFITENRDRPFCLYLAHECPHYPYQGPTDTAYRTPGHVDPIRGPRADQAQAYIEMMAAMDAGIGTVLQTLDELQLAADTFVFFFSDNGPAGPGSSGPLRGGKGTLWEGGHRVPAAARWPGTLPAGTTIEATCAGMDLLPTMMAAAGLALPLGLQLDGIDLLPVMQGGAPPERPLFWRFHDWKAARFGPWKLVVSETDTALFDLDRDLGERFDLAPAQPEIVARLLGLLADWEADVAGPLLT